VRCRSRTERVALVGSVCYVRTIETSARSKKRCFVYSQPRRCLQMVVGLRAVVRSGEQEEVLWCRVSDNRSAAGRRTVDGLVGPCARDPTLIETVRRARDRKVVGARRRVESVHHHHVVSGRQRGGEHSVKTARPTVITCVCVCVCVCVCRVCVSCVCVCRVCVCV
jgi:hypothetical protein